MSASIPHVPREGPQQLLNPCAPDCPACGAAEAQRATQEKASEGVRAIVLELWLQAIQDGERTLETALNEIEGPLAKLTSFERDQVLGQFVRRAMQLSAAASKGGKPRGLPTAWRRANYDIVNLIHEQEGLPLAVVAAKGKSTAFDRAVKVWAEWNIPVTARMVRDAYQHKK